MQMSAVPRTKCKITASVVGVSSLLGHTISRPVIFGGEYCNDRRNGGSSVSRSAPHAGALPKTTLVDVLLRVCHNVCQRGTLGMIAYMFTDFVIQGLELFVQHDHVCSKAEFWLIVQLSMSFCFVCKQPADFIMLSWTFVER